MTWEAIFFLAVLKIPVVYVTLVVWWAIRRPPEPAAGIDPVAVRARAPRPPLPGRPPARRGDRPRSSRRTSSARRGRVPA